MKLRRAIPLLISWAATNGCGGAQLRGAQEPAAAMEAGPGEEVRGDDRRQEILRLEGQIQARAGAVPSEGARQDAGAPGVNPPVAPGVSRTPGAEPASCEQACQASGSICQAAARICSLADDMDDDWARGRCRLASRTCADVRRRSTNACGTC